MDVDAASESFFGGVNPRSEAQGRGQKGQSIENH